MPPEIDSAVVETAAQADTWTIDNHHPHPRHRWDRKCHRRRRIDGALFAQRVELDYPRRVDRLVLIGAQTPVNENIAGLVEEALEDPVPAEFVRGFQESTIHQTVPQEFLDTVVSESLKLPARVWRDYLEGAVLSIDHGYVRELREVGAPTLVLWEEQRILFPREEQERLAAAIPGATLKIYPDTGHAVHWDRPEWVVRDLEEFMKGTRPHGATATDATEGSG